MIRLLPPNWSWVKLGDVSKRIHYGYTASAENKDVGPKLLRITDIQEGKVDWNEVPYCTIPSNDIHKYLLSENDIVFARTGATVGKSFLIKGKIPPSVFASYLIRLQLSDKTLPKFIYLFFQSNHYWSQIKDSSAGIGQPNVNAQKLSNLNLPLPPLPEQKIIVEKIEELFSGLDSGVASLKKAKEQIRLYRQSVLASAFSGKLVKDEEREKKNYFKAYLNGVQGVTNKKAERLNAIQEFTEQRKSEQLPYKQVVPKAPEPTIEYSHQLPEGWKWVKLGEIIKVGSGKGLTSANMFNDGMYPVYGGNGVSGYYKEFLFEEPRLIIGRVGAKCGVIHITKPKSWVTDNALIVEFKSSNVQMKFLYHCLDYHNLNKLSVSTAQPVISGAKIYPYEIMLPPLTEQTQIVEEIEKRFSEADNLEKAIDDSLAKSETLRQSILKQAFEGRLV